ncbi:VanZ family protein [Cytobacillus massiliigabonensis]|uniref:VanZ family protein n=1 Tax=Cytobacillus massiliigabonensis TaxID=1871011 RepID=UPI000C831E5B|nr:VanZ family protein [Cytobacillus massiliigabonensis]
MRKWIFRVLPFLYMGVIWTLSSFPANAVVELSDLSLDRFIKESMHLIEFAILYLLFVFAMHTTKVPFSKKINFACAVIACLYGITDEIHQSFVPARSATLIDVVKDVTGVAICSFFIDRAAFHKRFSKIAAFLRFLNKA